MTVVPNRNDGATRPLNQKRLVGGFARNVERGKEKKLFLFSEPRKSANSRRGFTLLELITVIAIIGILSSVVMVSLSGAREKARDGRRIAEVKNLQLALDFYLEVNSVYPTALSALVPTYISSLPKDPLTGNDYVYSALGSGSSCFSYHLGAILEDTGNSELGNDADASPGTACSGSPPVFHGNAVNCSGGTPATPDPCYDVRSQ